MNIVLIGPPGSGKSTQGILLGEKLHIPYFSVGQILRNKAEGTSEDAQMIKEYVDKGDLLPDSIMMPLVESYVAEIGHNGFIMDGFPRHIEQAKQFKQHIDKVIYVSLPDEEAIVRITHRTDKRNDQSEATILHRLDVFHEQTDKVIEYYRENGKLIEIDGMPSVEEIHTNILRELS